MRILVVEDYEPLRKSLAQGLTEAGYAVDAIGDGIEGLWYAEGHDYDAIILDVMLPRLDGLSILETLRKNGSQVPVLLLTARDTVEDRVMGLDKGADDYLVKPFAFEELSARVRALARRKYDRSSATLTICDLQIDTAARRVKRAGSPVELTAREYALLEFLAMRAGQIISRLEIWEHLYPYHGTVESNVIDVYVGYLRKKIEREGFARLIHTKRGQGYLLGESE